MGYVTYVFDESLLGIPYPRDIRVGLAPVSQTRPPLFVQH